MYELMANGWTPIERTQQPFSNVIIPNEIIFGIVFMHFVDILLDHVIVFWVKWICLNMKLILINFR